MTAVRSHILAAAALASLVLPLGAQRLDNRPATDSAVQSSPLGPMPKAPATDSARESSPELGPAPRGGTVLPAGEAVRVQLARAIDSGRLKNGDTVAAKLAAPVRTSSGATLPAGTAVTITVVESVPAGRLSAAGEFSLQAVRVGRVATATDFKVYRGQPGPKEVADAAPKIGTDAGLPAGATIVFHVLKPPAPDDGAPKNSARVPGAVNGVASGSAPPASAKSNTGEPVFGGGNGQQGNQNGNRVNGQAKAVQPADNSFAPAQHVGQASPAPNQPSAPPNATQGSSTQPR